MSLLQEERVVVEVSPRAILFADFEDESYYVELAPLVPMSEMERLEDLLDQLGLEIMDEDECPAEMIDSHNDELDTAGWMRVWCAKIDGIA